METMDTSPERLLIYIPTWNRPQGIRLQLDRLVPQIAANSSRVRLIVSDNATPNNANLDLAEKYGMPGVEFRSNPGNIGANANIALGFLLARPDEWLWILGDSDPVAPDAVKVLLDNLDARVDFCCFHIEPQRFGDDKGERVWPAAEALQFWELGTGLISAGIFNMRSFAPYIENAFYYHNSSFPHLAVQLAMLRGQGEMCIKFLPMSLVVAHDKTAPEAPCDYLLSSVACPLLAPLMPREQVSAWCRNWLRAMGPRQAMASRQHWALYLQSTAVLRYYGGIGVALRLIGYRLLFHTLISFGTVSLARHCVPPGLRKFLRLYFFHRGG